MCVRGVYPWLEITAPGVYDRCLIHYNTDNTRTIGALPDLEKPTFTNRTFITRIPSLVVLNVNYI